MAKQRHRNWKSYKRHPLSAEYPDLEGEEFTLLVHSLQQSGFDRTKPITLTGDREVLDGWQRQRACIEAGVKPEYRQFSPKWGLTEEEFVAANNDRRRHESAATIERRARERRERIAAGRQQGKSLRTLADEEGVHESTVRSDLDKVTAGGGAVTPPDDTVTGQDGRKQPARKPKHPRELACAACIRAERVGQPVPAKCDECKKLIKANRQPGDESENKRGSANGTPKQGSILFDVKAFDKEVGQLRRAMDRLYGAFGLRARGAIARDDEYRAMDKHLDAFEKAFKERLATLKKEKAKK
jgi:hypothetical protein